MSKDFPLTNDFFCYNYNVIRSHRRREGTQDALSFYFLTRLDG